MTAAGYTYTPAQNLAESPWELRLLHSLPRWLRSGATAPNDWGQVQLVNCTAAGSTPSCSFLTPALSGGSWPPGQALDIVEGAAVYAAIGIALAVLVLLYLVALVAARYCCCCCKTVTTCGWCRCGSPWPTRETRCWKCGFGVQKDGNFAYSSCSRWWFWWAILVVAVVGFPLCLGLAESRGRAYLVNTVAASPMGDTGKSAMAMLRGTAHAVEAATVAIASSAVAANFLTNVNTTIYTAINFPVALGAVACLNTTIYTLPNVTNLQVVLRTLEPASTAIGPVSSDLGPLYASTQSAKTLAGYLQTTLPSISASQVAVLTAANSTAFALNRTRLAHDTVLAATGAAAASSGYVTTLLRASDGGVVPDAATFREAAGTSVADTGNLLRLSGGYMDGVPSEQQELLDRLLNITAALQQLPQSAVVLAALNALSGNVTWATQTSPFAGITATAVAQLQAALTAMGPAGQLSSNVTDLGALVASTQGLGAMSSFPAAMPALANLGNVPTLVVQLAQAAAMASVIPCADTLGVVVTRVNATLLTLPASASEVTSLGDTLRSDLAPTCASAANMSVVLAYVQTNLPLSAVNTLYGALQNFNASLARYAAAVDSADLAGMLGGLETQRASWSGAAAATGAAQLQTALSALVVNSSLTNAINSVQTANTNLLNAMQLTVISNATYVSDLALLMRGYCASVPSVACDVDGDCAGVDTCTAVAMPRCRNDPTIACQQDSTCAAGDRCLADTSRLLALRTLLLTGDSSTYDVPGRTLVNAIATANSVGTSTMTAVDAATTATATLDTAFRRRTLARDISFIAGVNGNATVLAAVPIAATAMQPSATILQQLPLSQLDNEIEGVKPTLADLTGTYSPLINDYSATLTTLRDFTTAMIPQLQRRMGAGTLSAVLNADGFTGVLEAIADASADALNFIASGQSIVEVPSVGFSGSTVNSSSILGYVERASASGPTAADGDNGPFHYFGRLVMPDSVMAASAVQSGYTVLADASGARHANGTYCLTTACVAATASKLITGPLADAPAVFGASGSVSTSLSVSSIFILLHIPLGLLAGIGFLAIAGRWMCVKPEWQKVPVSWLAGLQLCMAPFFLIIAAIPFYVLIIVSDGCTTAGNVAVQVVELGFGDALCTSYLGGSGTLASCNLQMAYSSVGVNINSTLALRDLYRGIIGGCGAFDPVVSALYSVRPLLASAPTDMQTAMFGSGGMLEPAHVAAPLQQVFYRLFNDTAAVLDATVVSLGRDTLTCATAHRVVSESFDGMCNGVVKGLFWYAVPFFAAGVAMFFFGIPLAVMGRKRLPKKPWGPVYVHELDDSIDVKDKKSRGRDKDSSSKDRERDRSRDKDKDAASSRDKDSKDKDRDRRGRDDGKDSKSRDRERSDRERSDRDRSRDRDRDRDRERDRDRSSSRGRSGDRDRERERSDRDRDRSRDRDREKDRDKDRGRSDKDRDRSPRPTNQDGRSARKSQVAPAPSSSSKPRR